MTIAIEKSTPQAVKPMMFPQKAETLATDSTKKEPNKKEDYSKNKLLLTLAGLAVIAGGIYFATRGKGSNATKATSSLSSETKPASNISGMQKNAEIIPQISKEEQELTGLLEREKSKYTEIIKTMEAPEKIQPLPENKTDLNGIFKTTEKDKTTYHLYKQGEFKGTILPDEEGFLLKMDDKNSVFIWRDGSGIYYEVAKKETIPAEIIRNLDEKCISQEIGSLELTNNAGAKNNRTIGLHPLNSENKGTSLFFTFPLS